MLIKYNGEKDKKTIKFNSPTLGLVTYVFDPFCEIDNDEEECIAFLLSPDRMGLFSEGSKVESKKKVEAVSEPEPEPEDDDAQPEEKKKRGRRSRGK